MVELGHAAGGGSYRRPPGGAELVPNPAAHVFVLDGHLHGLIVERRWNGTEWLARVVFVTRRAGRWVIVEEWMTGSEIESRP